MSCCFDFIRFTCSSIELLCQQQLQFQTKTKRHGTLCRNGTWERNLRTEPVHQRWGGNTCAVSRSWSGRSSVPAGVLRGQSNQTRCLTMLDHVRKCTTYGGWCCGPTSPRQLVVGHIGDANSPHQLVGQIELTPPSLPYSAPMRCRFIGDK